MASRLDRLFALLESCPNETLRITAARQLGELAQKAPEDVDITLARLRGLLHSKSWKSRIAAAEAIRSMIAHLPPWLPTHKAMDTKEEGEEKKREKTSQSVATSFLSLAGLNLDLVLEHGARLYSMDLREFAKEKPNTAKRQKRGSSTEERRDSSAISTTTNVGVLLDRREMNRQLGLEDQANAFICTLLESQPNTSISSLICDADLADDEENTTSDSEGLGDMATSASVMESVKRAYKSANALSKTSVMKQDASALSPAEVAARTDWPLNGMCMRLLADLWDCRWETRHGAASGLRELLAFPQHTRQAGARNGASNEEIDEFYYILAKLGIHVYVEVAVRKAHQMERNRAANRIYLEDVVVRVLCTLALDQFSDFACDVIVAPVRQTAAQLLGVLCLHLDVGQVRLVVQHLLCLICLFRRQRHLKQQPTKRTHTPKVNWMVAHGSLLGLNYLLSARSDLAADLLPLIYGPLTDVLLLSYENDEDDTRKLGTEGVDVEAGEEDLRCAACNALLALPRDLLLAHCNAVGHRLVTYVWVLLERAAGELSPATGPLLTLASKLINYSVTTSTSEPHKGASASLTNGTCDLEQAEVFTKRVIMVLHFLHHSSSEIRRTAVETLDSLLSLRLQKSGGLMEVPLLECIFEQLFHRVLLESDTKIIHSVSDLWHRMVNAMPVGLLAHATLNRVDFWLCQAMQPTSLPFADNMLRLLTSSSSQETTQSYYIGGYELGSINERTRQNVALETRITATALLAYLSNRLCENNFSTALAVPPVATAETSPESMRSGDTRGSANDNVNVEMSVSGYILEHVVGGTHLRDRLGMQRFVGSLLLAAWPPAAAIATNMRGDLSSRLTNCLTNVVYYEEILGVFKAMHEDCHRLRALCEATRLPIDMGPPKAGGNVLNLVECQALLDRVGADLHKCASAEATSSTTNLTELEFEEVHRALQKAQLSVSRCLALQLFWSSRVELSLSSALVNFGWVTPGRLTPLIRPFMDTIRVTAATSAQPLNDFDLPQPGENLRLQRLAAWNLARLLWSESRQNFSASAPSTSAVSSSKALVKVTQNLTKYILPDEFIEWDALIDKTVKGGDDEGICLTALLMEEKTIPYGEKDDVCGGGGGNYCSTTAISSTTAPATGRKQSTQQLRRCGSFMALFALLRTFTADIDITKSKLEEILPQRLPTLWQILWLEPLAALHRRAGTSSNGSFAEDVKFLQKKCNVSSVERDTNPKASSDLEVFCRSLHLLPAVVFATLPSTGTSVPTGLITGLVSLTMRSLTGTASSSCSSTLSSSPRLRFTAAHTLAVLAASHSVLIVIILNTLFLLVASPDSPASDSDKVAALEAVYHIIDCILTPRAENQVFHNLQLVPCEQPLSPRLHGVSLDDSGKLSSSNSTSTPLQALLAYVVVMLTSLVLPHFADPRSNVRLLASNVFTKLLVLLPLEESAPEPPSPGLPPTLRATREKGRHFVQCLLRPNDINLYLPDENVHAELRPYQQEGVNWLLFLKQYGLHGILADDLGLGKTLQTICALVSHHGQGDRGRKRDRDRLYAHRKSADTSDEGSGVGMSLVICPATLCAHWQGEVKRFVPDRRLLEPRVYVGSLDQRVALQKSIWGRCNLLITTYEMVRNDLPFFQETFWEYLILDEGHIIKNAKSKISCAVKRLRARHRLILTGTPIQNRVSELWSLFDFLMPGFLAPSEAAFNARFARPLVGSRCPKATLQLQRAGQQALEELHRIVTPFVLRRLKEEVLQDLPPKVIQDYLCTMTPLQSKLYETFTKTPEGKEALNLALDQSTSASCIATTRLGSHGGFRSIKYLLAVCNHPRLVLTPEHPLYDWALENCTSERGGLDDFHLSGKLMALKQLLLDCGFGDSRNVTNNGEGCSSDDTLLRSESEEQNELLRQHRALIFFQTKKMLNLVTCLLNAEFKSLVHLRLDGSVSLAARQALVSRFNVDPSIDALLLTTAVGGLGLNLTGADTVIFVEHDWNPCRDLQAMDRAHRIGQRRVVSVFRLITADSIEERIMSLQTFKSHLARTLVSQPDNRALGEMDTSRLIDNMAAAAREGTSALMSAPSGDSDEPSWGDAEAAEYAAEYNMDEFLARLPREG